jgi:FPC/CPF motif-containing protein YcgG
MQIRQLHTKTPVSINEETVQLNDMTEDEYSIPGSGRIPFCAASTRTDVESPCVCPVGIGRKEASIRS